MLDVEQFFGLLTLFFLHVVIVPVDDHVVAYLAEHQLKRVHYLYVPALLFADQGADN